MRRKIAVIVGAGPAGLTSALELLRQSDITPIVIEADAQVGGISKTVSYRGNRMDLGGHRFFSKSDWVMRWWQDILPVAVGQVPSKSSTRINYQQQSSVFTPESTSAERTDAVMLVRRRLSRIFYHRRFYDYPLALSATTLKNLGFAEAIRIGLSYGLAQFSPKPEETLEDFLVNRFGYRLYRTFFKEYTEKVWGVPCKDISAEWGAQRIKGLSVAKAVAQAMAAPFRSPGLAQKHTETSLIEQFLYPKFGPGQMWEEVARRVREGGGQICLQQRIVGLHREGQRITGVQLLDTVTGSARCLPCDYLVSSMPVRDLIAYLRPENAKIEEIADRLPYRDFVTAGLLVRRMNAAVGGKAGQHDNGMPPDNWIYVQEPDVRMGRIQVFNNWSPAMVADPSTIWLGLEYFCSQSDDLWSMDKGQFTDFAANELAKLGLVEPKDVIDGTLVRVPKAYPAYFGAYAEFGKLRAYLDTFPNLYPIGRNGMHRYNNQDHSMLAAKAAVTSMVNGGSKTDIWNINVENEYHEQVASFSRSPVPL